MLALVAYTQALAIHHALDGKPAAMPKSRAALCRFSGARS
jgi:hypothetical protein